MGPVRPKAPGDRRPGVELAAKLVVSRLNLRLVHRGMPPHQVGARVLAPAKIKDLVFSPGLVVNARSGEGRHDATVDHGEAVLDSEFQGLVEAFGGILLETEDEGAEDINDHAVQIANVFIVITDFFY